MSNNYIVRQLVTIGITSLLLTSTTIVLAEYKPPRGQRPPSGRTTTTGSRGGCETNAQTPLKLLAPQKHVGQTASIYPTFAWFVPDSKPLPIEFRLYIYDDKGEPQLQHQFLMQSKYGIMSLSLPKNKPSLKVGKRYLWQVVILCDSDQPANNLVAMAEIDVVKMPAQVRMQRDDRANVDILAEAGLWYDALGKAMRLGQKDVIHGLLKNLTALETTESQTTSTP
ncbi:hypothetical protein DSM106972_031110 [Dulcicalothrix desertica PCC 7102]|uniref:DUF928 domain-containing protein n=1 Tax=Dulcicalothrix desertica PCC 7102 TaxID=232991 RepID=A0A3S1D995_9CYAN|nr:DUF928 domain-containing protein [Dulcicalothrix desertica]RUT05905.1 hypothetical protein DSM106972_031110 [Dulcicalothrix desertica PCC 7102]TWH54398.1 uncharacterized protein DUF928 [Dulcicalothrix desertica PCC 7102]